MLIKNFEGLKCWQSARNLTNTIYKIAKQNFSRDYRLTDQITGASISIMNNISEGFDSDSNPEFIRFLKYSRRSASEVQNCLYIALDQSYIYQEIFNKLYLLCEEIRKTIDGLIKYLKNSS